MSIIGPKLSTNAVAPDSGVGRSSREATPTEVLQFLIKKVEAIDPALAASGRAALQRLTGRPAAVRRRFGKWRHGGVVTRYVKRLVPRERDPEAVTEIGDQLVRLASRLIKPRTLTPGQCARLRKMAVKAKPSQITRMLLALRSDVSDRAVRHLQHRNIAVCRWG